MNSSAAGTQPFSSPVQCKWPRGFIRAPGPGSWKAALCSGAGGPRNLSSGRSERLGPPGNLTEQRATGPGTWVARVSEWIREAAPRGGTAAPKKKRRSAVQRRGLSRYALNCCGRLFARRGGGAPRKPVQCNPCRGHAKRAQASQGRSTPTKAARLAENAGLCLTWLHVTEGLAFAFRLCCIFSQMTVVPPLLWSGALRRAWTAVDIVPRRYGLG